MGMLQASLKWNQKMQFTAEASGHQMLMDAKSPIGHDTGPTPKEFLLLAMAGCPAMDIVALLKKYRQEFSEFNIVIEADKTDPHPQVFTETRLIFKVSGPVDPEKFKEAAKLSLTKYCGVNAMMSKATPIVYSLVLNNETIHQDKADFQI